MGFLRRGFYWILLLSFLTIGAAYGEKPAKCVSLFAGDEILGPTVSSELKMIWRDLLALDARKVVPNKAAVLELTKLLSIEIARELDRKGFRTNLYIAPEEVFPNFNNLTKPARWVVEFVPDTLRDQQRLSLTKLSRQKIIIQNALSKHEAKIYFDFFGLWLSYSSGVTDYDGQTRMGFNKELFELLDEDFVSLLLHEIHHAFNHKRLKRGGGKNGLNAEVNVFPEALHNFKIDGYRNHFHFDEIIANYRQYNQIASRIRLLRAVGNIGAIKREGLEEQLEDHLKLLLSFTQHARLLTRRAMEFMKTEKAQEFWDKKIIWYFPDIDHDSHSAHIPLMLPGAPELQQIKFTVWLPGAKNLERTEANKEMIVSELEVLYENVLYYRREALRLKRQRGLHQ